MRALLLRGPETRWLLAALTPGHFVLAFVSILPFTGMGGFGGSRSSPGVVGAALITCVLARLPYRVGLARSGFAGRRPLLSAALVCLPLGWLNANVCAVFALRGWAPEMMGLVAFYAILFSVPFSLLFSCLVAPLAALLRRRERMASCASAEEGIAIVAIHALACAAMASLVLWVETPADELPAILVGSLTLLGCVLGLAALGLAAGRAYLVHRIRRASLRSLRLASPESLGFPASELEQVPRLIEGGEGSVLVACLGGVGAGPFRAGQVERPLALL